MKMFIMVVCIITPCNLVGGYKHVEELAGFIIRVLSHIKFSPLRSLVIAVQPISIILTFPTL
jgi:hypothetical protein